jgi:ubiquitin-protein ligase
MLNVVELFTSFSGEHIQIYPTNIPNQLTFTSNNIEHTVDIQVKNDNIHLINKDISKQNTTQLVNIVNSKFNNVNDIFDIVEFVSDIFSKTAILTNFCVICQKTLDFQSDTYICCGEQSCLYKYEESYFGNIVIEKVKNDPEISVFLIQSAFEAIKSGRKMDIFEPFPRYFLKNDNVDVIRGTLSKLTKQNYDHLKDFDKLLIIINNFDLNNIVKFVDQVTTDYALMLLLGNDLYVLLRFILLSCTQSIKRDQSEDFMGIDKNVKVYTLFNKFDEDKFNVNKEPTQFLFHGSNWANWYSIFRNGLKNCSKTKLMTAGAAYGNGIYLSDDANLSFNYGHSGTKSVIGVFEVINGEKYKKTDKIYVVDNELVLMQKYLLIIPSSNYCVKINSAFNRVIHIEKKDTQTFYNNKCIAKIIREYKIIKKNKNPNFKIDVDSEYPFQWKIFIFGFDAQLPLYQDMKKLNISEIELELKFPPNYPFAPPFIRVVKPRFERLTGHVTLHGAICHEILTKQGWSSTCSIESLITLIFSEIAQGEGRLDMKKWNVEYNLEDAKTSFLSVCKSHGWS